MPGISFDNLLSIRNTNSKNTADPTNSKTHLQSCIRFASRFIKLRSPLKPFNMRQSTSLDILRHDNELSPEKTRMNRAFSSPDFSRFNDQQDYLPKHYLSDQSVFIHSKKNHLHKRRNSSDMSKLYISDKKSFISQPASKEKCLQDDSDDDEEDDDDEEEMTIRYAKPATAFLVSLSPSAAAAASAARYRRRRQVRVVSQGLVTLVSS